jgi:outer membrane protein TolC
VRSTVQATVELELARAEAKADATVAYARLWTTEKRLETARAAQKLAATLAQAAELRLSRGDVSEVDAALLVADAARLSADAQAVALEREEAVRTLALVVGGHLPDELGTTQPVPPPERVPAAAEPFDALVLVRDRAEVEAAEAAVRAEERAAFPHLGLSVTYEKEQSSIDSPVGHLHHRAQMLGARLSIPLPLWNHRRAEVARAQAEAERSRAHAAASQRTYALRRSVAVRRAQTALENERALTATNDRTDRALVTVQRALEQGQLNLGEFLLKRDALLQAKLAVLSAQLERVIAVAELERLFLPAGRSAP